MEKDIFEDFNMDKFNELATKIKAGSPVHKINFNLENPNAIAGFYLISMDDIKSYIDKIIDRNNVDDNTLLVFESRHVIECCQIIYGVLSMIDNINNSVKFSYRFIIERIINDLLTKPLYYDDAIKKMDAIAYESININNNDNSAELAGRFMYILRNVWFIPYGKIDEMAAEAIKEFKKFTGDDNNE